MEKLITKGLLILSLVLTFSVHAQELSVSGTVVDETGPLPGASIIIKGTTTGVETDFDGNYTIAAKSNDILVVAFIGYITQEIAIAGRTTVNIDLIEDANQLDEVVVVGYGTQKKGDVTGAASFVEMDKIIADRPIVNAAQGLQGIASGLQVVSTSGQPGSTGTSLNIRGYTSINGGSPLVLVNNVPMSLNDVNPQDIQSVSVLKDAAASSIYGARAAFGVILITTKTAKRNQKMKFSYSATTSLSTPIDLPENASTKEFVNALNDFGMYDYFAGQVVGDWLNYIDIYENNPSSLEYLKNPVTGENYPIVFEPSTNRYYPVDDSDVIGDFLDNNGFSSIHNFTMNGGAEKISYRLNGGYSYEDGVMTTDKDSFKKYNLNSYIDADLTSNLKSTTNILYRTSHQSRPIARYSGAIQSRMYDPTGYFETSDGEILPFDTAGNTVRERVPSSTDIDNLRLFQKLEWEPIKNLKITGEYTYEKRHTNTFSKNNGARFVSAFKFSPNTSEETAFASTRIAKGYSKREYNAINIYASYDYSLNENHTFKILAGLNDESQTIEGFSSNRNGLIDPTLDTFNLAIGDAYGIGDSYNEWAVFGYFGRLNYNYKRKYFVEASARYDGSSRFLEGDRFAFLPSVSAGWTLSKESFLENVDWLSNLKLRGSWGEIGNQSITKPNSTAQEYYPQVPGYEDYNASWVSLDSNQRYLTLRPGQLVSAGYTWETVRTTNVGIDAGFFKNKLSTTVELYKRETLGMLSEGVQLPSLLGTTAPEQNVADLETRGWEFEVKWNHRVGELKYGLNFNIFDSESKITKFNNESGLINDHFVGKTLGDIWGYVTDGFYTVDDFVEGTLDANLSGDNRQLKDDVVQIENANTPYPGDVKFVDLNGDGVINTGNNSLIVDVDESGNVIPNTGPGDRKVIGNNRRKYQFGFNGFAEYKGFDFSFVLSGVGKRDLWRSSDLIWPYPGTFDHIYKHQLNYWTPDNQDAWYPRVYGNPDGNTGSNYGRSRAVQTKYLSDESYLSIQNLTFGYSIDQNALDRINISKLRVFVSANNIHTFDNLPKGLEPEQGSNGVYPIMSSYSVGLNLSF